jgi:hypothetical protein
VYDAQARSLSEAQQVGNNRYDTDSRFQANRERIEADYNIEGSRAERDYAKMQSDFGIAAAEQMMEDSAKQSELIGKSMVGDNIDKDHQEAVAVRNALFAENAPKQNPNGSWKTPQELYLSKRRHVMQGNYLEVLGGLAGGVTFESMNHLMEDPNQGLYKSKDGRLVKMDYRFWMHALQGDWNFIKNTYRDWSGRKDVYVNNQAIAFNDVQSGMRSRGIPLSGQAIKDWFVNEEQLSESERRTDF